MKKVSIIISNFNKGKYVSESVESALNQTYQNIEIICIDDASTDESYNILKDYANHCENIVLIRNIENKGVIYSRNAAIDICTGDYVLPLDSDDIIEPRYIEEAVKVLDLNPEIGIVYCNADFIGRKRGIWNLPEFDKEKILYENCIFCTALFRKSDFINAGKYKDYMDMGWEDYDLWLSFIEMGLKPYKIPKLLFHYRLLNESTRSTIANANILKLRKIIVKKHIELYINNDYIIEKIFKKDFEMKYKKYKKLFHKLVFLLLIFIILVIILGGKILCLS